MFSAGVERRHPHAHRHLQARHRSRTWTQQLVQNRVTQAEPRLPDVTSAQIGVTTVKSLARPHHGRPPHCRPTTANTTSLYLRNYAVLNVKDQPREASTGVGNVRPVRLGRLRHAHLAQPAENRRAGPDRRQSRQRRSAHQNVQVSRPGSSAGPPYVQRHRACNSPINAQGRLTDPLMSSARSSIKRNANGGAVTLLRDVARIEIDAAAVLACVPCSNNKSAVALPIFQSPGSNAIAISPTSRPRHHEAALGRICPQGVELLRSSMTPTRVRARIDPKRWCTRCSRPSWPWWFIVVIVFSCRRGAPRSSRFSPCRSRSSARSAIMHLFGFSINALSAFRARAGHRHRGGRCHRRGRERGA